MVRTMRTLVTCCGVVVFALATAFAAQGQQSSAANQQTGLVIAAQPAASALVGRNVSFPLIATGGSAPYSWRLVDGQLPPGLKLHAHSGAISGVPATAGECRFTVAVADSSAPPLLFPPAFVRGSASPCSPAPPGRAPPSGRYTATTIAACRKGRLHTGRSGRRRWLAAPFAGSAGTY